MRLKADNISFRYQEGRYILRDLTFEAGSGEVVGLTAPSGFGKTTLAKILAGYEKPERGTVMVESDKASGDKAGTAGVKSIKIGKRGYHPVQLVFQHPEKSVNPKWKMRKILAESEMPSEELMEAMGIQKGWLDRWPGELSGGELQRFCVLRALSPKTRFLIADEMTTMLDPITQAQIWKTVLDYADRHQMGVVVISHDRALLQKICSRVVDLIPTRGASSPG